MQTDHPQEPLLRRHHTKLGPGHWNNYRLKEFAEGEPQELERAGSKLLPGELVLPQMTGLELDSKAQELEQEAPTAEEQERKRRLRSTWDKQAQPADRLVGVAVDKPGVVDRQLQGVVVDKRTKQELRRRMVQQLQEDSCHIPSDWWGRPFPKT